MSMPKFGLSSYSAILLLLVWGIGCMYILGLSIEDTPAAQAEQPHKIKLLVRTGNEAAAMRQAIPTFEQETGIGVEMIELSRDVYFTTLATQLFAGSDDFDLVFVPSTYVAQFALGRVLLPLDSFMRDPQFTDEKIFDQADFMTTYSYNQKVYALPTDISTHFLYYRSDLIPNPPQTWDEVSRLAARWTKKSNPDSPTEWGIGLTGLAPEELPKVFDTMLWSFGGDLLNEDNEVYLDSSRSVEAGQYWERWVKDKVVPPDVLSWGFSEVRDALMNGDIAMAAPYWNAAYDSIRNSNSRYKDVIKVAMIPGTPMPDGSIRRATFQHGWALSINAKSPHPQEAWRFISYITGKRGGVIYARAGGTPARQSILSDPLLQYVRPEFALVLESMKIARNEPAIPFYPLMIDIENDALTQILTLHTPPGQALQTAGARLRSAAIHFQANAQPAGKENLP
ncbi:extracellular solute-binding protein [Paenibacillus thalictri]|uniref:Extracellular solute-binding protein n=1 Tax=Paenibacillus thalictri TaxID=2527873 RepID=A0A4Q9DG34_9BACL|nr:extracellular solute-binding protein [Paenibacillus thalictri]TBL70518.1 extracellular solute-binding protein [Paenibacillus thalictri]